MRLGAYPCVLDAGHASRREAYGATEISERHRHRYEFNNDYREQLVAGGARARAARRPTSGSSRWSSSATTRTSSGCQFHPEFKSRPRAPHPLFARFVRAALERGDRPGEAEGAQAAGEHEHRQLIERPAGSRPSISCPCMPHVDVGS